MLSAAVRSVLLIDDLVTTGQTTAAIIRALKKAWPDVMITVFSLAKTDFNPDINKALDLHGKKYRWAHWKWIEISV